MNALTLGNTEIRQLDGLYSLNDLHQAAGGEAKHEPYQFMRNDQTQALVAELCSADSRIIPTKIVRGRGKQQGTYVCRELVIAYAAWISAAFYLKMIRAFDAQQVPAQPTLPHLITTEQRGEIRARLEARFPEGKDRPYAWSRFCNHFALSPAGKGERAYWSLPAGRYAEALAYIDQMPIKGAAEASIEAHEVGLLKHLARARFVLTFDDAMRMNLRELPNEAIYIEPAELPALIASPGEFPRRLLPAIISAAAGRLSA